MRWYKNEAGWTNHRKLRHLMRLINVDDIVAAGIVSKIFDTACLYHEDGDITSMIDNQFEEEFPYPGLKDALVTVGYIEFHNDRYEIRKWHDRYADVIKNPTSGAERTKRWRQKQKTERQKTPDDPVIVTKCDARDAVTLRDVTPSQPVTLVTTVTNVTTDEMRLDEIRLKTKTSNSSSSESKPKSTPARRVMKAPSPEVDEIFQHWVGAFNLSKRHSLTKTRNEKIRALLKIYTVPQVKTIIDNLALSDFHVTNGHFGWSGKPLSSAKTCERWLNPLKPNQSGQYIPYPF